MYICIIKFTITSILLVDTSIKIKTLILKIIIATTIWEKNPSNIQVIYHNVYMYYDVYDNFNTACRHTIKYIITLIVKIMITLIFFK